MKVNKITNIAIIIGCLLCCLAMLPLMYSMTDGNIASALSVTQYGDDLIIELQSVKGY